MTTLDDAHHPLPGDEPPGVSVPDRIDCIDCGGDAFLLSYRPPEGFQHGDNVAYRCRDCLDRWDLLVGDPTELEDADDEW